MIARWEKPLATLPAKIDKRKVDVFCSQDFRAQSPLLGSARGSRAGKGALAFANFTSAFRRRQNRQTMSEDLLNLFRKTGALLNGHFILRSGLHSREYFQCALLLQYTDVAARVCKQLADKLREFECDSVI
ncbi:MAG: orotate phosphoribosyltransferase, partial [Verrucomicrobiota bacterium]